VGTYICQFSRDGLYYVAQTQVKVFLLPTEIFLTPLQLSLQAVYISSSPLSLQCCALNDGENYTVTWNYGQNSIPVSIAVQQADLQCYTGSTPQPTTDTTYTCTFTNQVTQTKTGTIVVTVIQATDKVCNTDTNTGVTWNLTKAGLQSIANCPAGTVGNLTRNCSVGGLWLEVENNCISLALKNAMATVQALQDGLGNLNEKVPQIMQQLSSPGDVAIGSPAAVNVLVNVLGTVSQVSASANTTFETDVVTNFLSVASNLTDPSLSSFWKKSGPDASQVMSSVETFSRLLKVENDTFEIPLQNIQLVGNSFSNESGIDDYNKSFEIGVSTFIRANTIERLMESDNITITSLVFNTVGNLLPSSTGKFQGTQLNSIIQSTLIKQSGSAVFSGEVYMTFAQNSTESGVQHCVFWDFQGSSGGGWSDQGCTTKVDKNVTLCTCNHLTSFAVLMSISAVPLLLIDEITYAGLGASLLSLCVCLIVEKVVWKHVVKTNISYFRHISLLNITISLLIADACFFSTAFPSMRSQKYVCLAITFLNHFFYLALFFWTFCQSVMLLHQLLFVFHHLRKKVFLSFSFCMGYLFPALVAAATLLYYNPKDKYLHKNVCWLNPDTGAIYAFAIPAGSVIMFNFMALLVVISKLSRPSVSEANRAEDKDTAKSIMKAVLVLTPVFGLTWCFGFALLKDLDDLTKKVFTYGFAGLNAFQGFFILLTCITDKKVSSLL
ncbi:hypothetical protein GDO86_010512, partial [Hymenochirus boettgeri]